MYHTLAVTTLGIYLVFIVQTFMGLKRDLIRSQLVNWYDQESVPKTQLVHSYFALVLLVLLLVTFLFAPTGRVIWIVMIINYCMSHLKFRPKIELSDRNIAILRWTSGITETLYLIFLAFGI